MRTLILCLLILLCFCKETENTKFNFRNGTALAEKQDSLIQIYKDSGTISKSEIKEMNDNLWVQAAMNMAPNNLVIRQLCLIDLFQGSCRNKKFVENQMDYISGGDDGNRIWLEGYSYWQYTRDILDFWLIKFKESCDFNKIMRMLIDIDNGFIRTAYKREDKWYPAPFGDLRDITLTANLQYKCNELFNHPDSVNVNGIKKIKNELSIIYYIEAEPLGFNMHTMADNDTVEIIDGIPQDYDFYTGYPNKYKNKEEEFRSMLRKKRTNSIGSWK